MVVFNNTSVFSTLLVGQQVKDSVRVNVRACQPRGANNGQSERKTHSMQTEDAYARSPRMRRASWMSLGMMVTRLAWMAAKLVSSNNPTK